MFNQVLRCIFSPMNLMSFFAEATELVRLTQKAMDPYGCPRPEPGQKDVPLKTSFYFEMDSAGTTDQQEIDPDSIEVTLHGKGQETRKLFGPAQKFEEGATGYIVSCGRRRSKAGVGVYIDPGKALVANTHYRVEIHAKLVDGSPIPEPGLSWEFQTGEAEGVQSVSFPLDLRQEPLHWHGAFFSGFLKPSFCTSLTCNRIPGYELMKEAHDKWPKAWSYQRDFWMTGMQNQGSDWAFVNLPNIVRERETRRIVKMERKEAQALLYVEDFFGHQEYGIPSNRPVSQDYHPGDEILIADGNSSARTRVVSADDARRIVRVEDFQDPEKGWAIEYRGPLPRKENPQAPGLFPSGGCYLKKFNPVGTPHYFWKRLDLEIDIAYRMYGRKVTPNFADAPGDLAVDGRNYTYPKDYAQLHEVTHAITSHLIERYGDACLDFPWAIFNEPDLTSIFWVSADWLELQKFYDYSVDAILRAFEDHGYDSGKVFIGGLELGAVSGTNLRLADFLAHCSPRAQKEGALAKNAAYADARLDGKRSRRMEALCQANNGKGTPCDFVSIHAYNSSEMMAAKMQRAKEMALEIDAEFYDKLWINSHESCPEWSPLPDRAADDSYLGNGYFPTWCADFTARQLLKAKEDPRYAYGEYILTFWPWPNKNFWGHNDVTRIIHIDEDGDGVEDRTLTLPMPIFHFVNLLCSMADDYWVLPVEQAGGHRVTGFATRAGDDLRILLYSHDRRDPQSRSEKEFAVTIRIEGLEWQKMQVREYRFDKDNNSYFYLGKELRRQPETSKVVPSESEARLIVDAIEAFRKPDPDKHLELVQALGEIGAAAHAAVPHLERILQYAQENDLKKAIHSAIARISPVRMVYKPEEIEPVVEKSKLRCTRTGEVSLKDGLLCLTAIVGANGANFIEAKPA